MADWKQITARIRRARTGKDPAGQLSTLYEKTHDAMVAFELARHFETASQNTEAAKWYSTAAARFRRADWKTKAQEAATRLGAEGPFEARPDIPALASPTLPIPEPGLPFEHNAAVFEGIVEPPQLEEQIDEPRSEASDPEPSSRPAAAGGRRRRGRRGGRNRRRGGVDRENSAVPAQHPAERGPSSRPASPVHPDESTEPRFGKLPESSLPKLPVEPTPAGDAGGIALRGRYGDPGLSSRLSLLEMQFRRLLTCAPVKLEEADRAPAGPGVFLVTDSDLTSYYYVEACQTLRIAVANLLRGGSTRRGVESIKPQLAEHLGIPESRVGKYLADHCVVRWLQLDEGASHFAHFVIAVLRPVLNE